MGGSEEVGVGFYRRGGPHLGILKFRRVKNRGRWFLGAN